MSKIRHTLVGICIASASLSVMAQTADEHKAHHPAGSTSPAPSQMKAAAKPTGAGQMAGMAKMDEQMKAMQAMHEKMMAAKTPEERQALMDEHMKLMQDGMGMMQQMGAGHGWHARWQGHAHQHGRAPSDDGKAHANDGVHDADDAGPPACLDDQVTHPPNWESP